MAEELGGGGDGSTSDSGGDNVVVGAGTSLAAQREDGASGSSSNSSVHLEQQKQTNEIHSSKEVAMQAGEKVAANIGDCQDEDS